jgi:2-iminobutanoate/2-iminopropanoate deaminase
MTRDIIRTPDAPPPPPTYSQAVRAAGLVFVSGTGPHDPVTGKIVGDTIQEQTRQCLANVSAILKAAGTSLDRVASATVILLEESDFAGMNEEWVKWFPANPPARQGAKLPVRIPGLRVSIAAIAEAYTRASGNPVRLREPRQGMLSANRRLRPTDLSRL